MTCPPIAVMLRVLYTPLQLKFDSPALKGLPVGNNSK